MSSVFKDNSLQKWIWIELIGFDNEKFDYGVSDYMERCDFVPDGFTLLLYWTGFVIDHRGLDREYELSPAEASYGAHKYCPERCRQSWSNLQLRDLITVLQSYGCKVYLSFFNMYTYHNDAGMLVACEYYIDKQYLKEINRNAIRQDTISMLKKLLDGGFYEDFLQEKIVRTLVDYGFDGIQIADGISSPRIALQEGDYSDDITAQFLKYSGLTLPAELAVEADDNAEVMEQRAALIWQEYRVAWIKFHTVRWEQFFIKFMSRLKSAGKEGIFNNAWTRDPFEAIYRYGVDYRKVAKTGVEGCVVEDVSAGLAILSKLDNGYLMNDEQRRRVHYEFLTALMLNRAAMPDLRITPLAGVHDTMEQWGVLEHMPTSMTRNFISNLNTYIVKKDGLNPITDGPYFCLGDSLTSSDWSFICKNWEKGFTRTPRRVSGVTLVWSDGRLDQELETFIASRRTPTHRLVSELMYAGAPIYAVVRIEDLEYARGPILVTNPDLLPINELKMVLSYENGAVLLLGTDFQLPQDFETAIYEENSFGGMRIAVASSSALCDVVRIRNDAEYDFDPKFSRDPVWAMWTCPLYFAPVSDSFFAECAAYIVRISNAPIIEAAAESETGRPRQVCKYICVETGENSLRIFVSNDDYYYNHPKIDVRRNIKNIQCLTKYFGYKVDFSGSSFTVRVPGRGMEVLELQLEEKLTELSTKLT